MSSSVEVEAAARAANRKTPVRLAWLGAVTALAAAAGFAAFFLLRDEASSEPGATAPAGRSSQRAVSIAGLREAAAQADQPIYWAGLLRGRKYELTETPDGSRIYVRYLPQRTPVGSARPYLTIATYRVSNAFAATRAVSRLEGSTPIKVGNGGVAFYAADHPTSVYLAYPESDYQVEVFHPQPDISHDLVASGRVRRIGANG